MCLYIDFSHSISIDFVNVRKLVFINVHNIKTVLHALYYIYLHSNACQLALVPQEKENPDSLGRDQSRWTEVESGFSRLPTYLPLPIPFFPLYDSGGGDSDTIE